MSNTCASCGHFIGAGDYNLCCDRHSWLCYRDTEACEMYEYMENRVRSLEEQYRECAEGMLHLVKAGADIEKED